jgi:serine/threonine-protein kinase
MARELRPGEVIDGKYVIEGNLGGGGMGYVVLATHPILGACAIKLLKAELADNADLVARFVREAQAAQRIQNEHVVRVQDVSIDAERGTPYIVMERLHGLDLAELLEERGPLPLESVVDYVLQGCEALAEAHLEGIVHRDLKPANFFLTRRRDGSPFVKVLDFGISKASSPGGSGEALTRPTGIMGTAEYMSPEQLQRPRDVDARADIWALGVVLYQLLSGQLPFVGEDLPSTVTKIVLGEPEPLVGLRPDLPESMLALVDRCLQKDREVRFASIPELATALAEFAPPRALGSVERIVSLARASGIPIAPASRPPRSSRPANSPSSVPAMVRARAETLAGDDAASQVSSADARGARRRRFALIGAGIAIAAVAAFAGAQFTHAGAPRSSTGAAGASPEPHAATSAPTEPKPAPTGTATPTATGTAQASAAPVASASASVADTTPIASPGASARPATTPGPIAKTGGAASGPIPTSTSTRPAPPPAPRNAPSEVDFN